MVACVPAVEDLTVTRFPAVPVRPKLKKVLVEPAVKATVVGLTVLVMLLNVLLPLIVSAPAPP